MLEFLINALNVRTITALFAGLAAAATVLTLAMPFVFVDPLDKRMRAVALEREKIRQRETRAAGAGRPEGQASADAQAIHPDNCRAFQTSPNGSVRKRRGSKLIQAGYRGQAPYVTYLFFRMLTPVACFLFALLYLFVILKLDQPAMIKLGVCIAAAYVGMQLPLMLLKNKIQRRQLSSDGHFPTRLTCF